MRKRYARTHARTATPTNTTLHSSSPQKKKKRGASDQGIGIPYTVNDPCDLLLATARVHHDQTRHRRLDDDEDDDDAFDSIAVDNETNECLSIDVGIVATTSTTTTTTSRVNDSIENGIIVILPRFFFFFLLVVVSISRCVAAVVAEDEAISFRPSSPSVVPIHFTKIFIDER